MTQIVAMVLSMAIEAPVAAATAWRLRLAPARAAVAALVGTLITHPALWRGFGRVADAVGYWPALAGLEAAVAGIEAVIYRVALRSGWGAALLVALAANAASVALGMLIQRVAWG